MGKLEPVTENKPAECEKKMSFAVPVLEDKFRRSNFMNNQIDKISRVGYAVAIDKIINSLYFIFLLVCLFKPLIGP